jgi:hypothetical protein
MGEVFMSGAEKTDNGSVYLSYEWHESEVCVFLQPFAPTLRLISTAAV